MLIINPVFLFFNATTAAYKRLCFCESERGCCLLFSDVEEQPPADNEIDYAFAVYKEQAPGGSCSSNLSIIDCTSRKQFLGKYNDRLLSQLMFNLFKGILPCCRLQEKRKKQGNLKKTK